MDLNEISALLIAKSKQMEQPDLGIKITELRNEKGLTQEELVAKCNISVRTIQRIESGEVTPRSYTVKTILAALDADYQAIKGSSGNLSEEARINIRKILTISITAGIAYFLLAFIEVPMDVSRFELDFDAFVFDFSSSAYILVKSLVAISLTLFLIGFYYLGKKLELTFLKIASIAYLSVLTAGTILDIVSLHYTALASLPVLITETILIGSAMIGFAIALLQLKSYSKWLTITASLLTGFTGFFFVTIILAIPALLLLSMVELFQIILLAKVYIKLGSIKRSA